MTLNQIVDDFIRTCRASADADLEEFRNLSSLSLAIRHGALCHWLPEFKRHPHQCRIPLPLLETAERKLQRKASILSRAATFEVLHDAIYEQIKCHGIGPLTIYDIAQRIGAFLGKAPRLVYAIRPKFHLDARIGRKDRIALIARYPQLPGWKGLEFWGLGEQFLYMPTAMGMLINNIALVSLSSDFLLARHLRNIVPKWVQNDNLLQSAKLDPLDNKHDVQRLSVLGLPDVIGQCIAPKDAMENDIKLDHVRENPRHKTLLETPVMRLNTDLASTNGDLGNVREVSTDVHAHTLLMEMNVSLASVYMLRDFLRSDFSAVANKGKLEKNITIYNGLLLAEIAHIRDVKSKYRERTGLVLPVEA